MPRSRLSVVIAAAAAALLLLAGCGGGSAATPSPDQAVKTQVGKARDTVAALLQDDPRLSSHDIDDRLLATKGYHTDHAVEVWFSAGKGAYCVWGVQAKQDGPYGITAKRVWFADSDNTEVRPAPVREDSGAPVFQAPGFVNGKRQDFPGPCGHLSEEFIAP